MYYVCVEDEKVSSVLNYEPNTPESVTVYKISDEEYALLMNRTHYFDTKQGSVKPNSKEMNDEIASEKEKQNAQGNLSKTDWKVLRHIREKALGIPTTLTDAEYIALENLRQKWVNLIRAN